MNKRIKLRVTKIAAKHCGSYVSCENCLIAAAAKRQFRTSSVCAWPGHIKIAGIQYAYGHTVEDKILRCYIRKTEERRIRPDFRPFNIILTPLPSL